MADSASGVISGRVSRALARSLNCSGSKDEANPSIGIKKMRRHAVLPSLRAARPRPIPASVWRDYLSIYEQFEPGGRLIRGSPSSLPATRAGLTIHVAACHAVALANVDDCGALHPQPTAQTVKA